MRAPYRVPPEQPRGRATEETTNDVDGAVLVVWALSLVRCFLVVSGREDLDVEPILALAIVAGFAGRVVRCFWKRGILEARGWTPASPPP
jgi:hypothetical protein